MADKEPQADEAAEGQNAPEQASAPEDKKKKKKGKPFDPLSDDPVKFKKIDFESALTAEEKAAKKAEKLAAKKGGKKKKEKAEPETAEGAPPAAVEGSAPPKDKKDKKGKKQEADESGAEVPAEEKEGKKVKGKKGKEEASAAEGDVEQGKGKKKGKADKEPASTEGEGAGEKKGKKKGKADKEPTSPTEGEEAGEKKGKKKGKAEKEPTSIIEEDTGEDQKKGKKKGKGKDAQEGKEGAEEGDKKEKGEQGAEEETVGEGGGEAPIDETQVEDKKGKKGKGKKAGEGKGGKKGKKGKVEEEKHASAQMSITAFLERHASTQEKDDEWTWESYSVSEESIKVEVKEKEKKGKGKEKKGKKEKKKAEEAGEAIEGETEEKKGKKGKGKGKKGKGDEKPPEPAPEPEVSTGTDIMAEIRKMKEAAEAAALAELTGEVVEEPSTAPPKKPKKSKKPKPESAEGASPKEAGPKKKLSKKEKKLLAAAMAEQARIQAELDAKRAEEEERIRLIEERKAAIEKEKRETIEQRIRQEQLTNSVNLIQTIKNFNLEKAGRDREHDEWEHFLRCDGLPNPYVCGEMNTYLHLWEKALESTTINEAAARTKEVLKLLEMLTTFIDDPIGATQTQIDNWNWIHHLFREHQQQSLDTATYRLLRGIDKNLNSLNLLTSDYQRKEDDFGLALWVLIRLPTALPNPRKPAPPRIHLDFPDMNMNVLFPISIDCHCMAIRAMYVKYDHLSDLCSSYPRPSVPEQYSVGIDKTTLQEWYSKLHYKYDCHQNFREPTEEGAEVKPKTKPVPLSAEDRAAGNIPIVPYRKWEPTASTHVIAAEDTMYMEVRQSLITNVEEHVMNLRKYIVVGGVFFINLYYQPPQPLDLVSMEMDITRLKIPKCLGEVPFHVDYHTPPPIDPAAKRDPGELEEEAKKQEEELDRLLLVTVTLPSHIMWLDIPVICQWDDEKCVWTTKDIHDVKHFEENRHMTFKTARFGCFSFAVNRYQNMPFQAWEIKPELNGSVTFQLTAAILLVKFNIKDDLVCILQFQNTPNNVLQEIVGKYYKLPRLMRILQEGGLDFFPGFDAFCYVENTCEKHWPMEEHLYYNMAQLCTGFNFAWSRWNIIAGRRGVVMQIREYKPERMKQIPHSMLSVTPLRAVFIDCTEISETFSEEPIEGMHFYSDLYHLFKGAYGMATRNRVQNAKPELVVTVVNLLLATRVLSLS